MSIPDRWVGPMPIEEFFKEFVPPRAEEMPLPPTEDGHYFHIMLAAMTPKKTSPRPPKASPISTPKPKKEAQFHSTATPSVSGPASPPDADELQFRLEKQMYNPFIKSIQSTKIMPSMEICNTSVKSDPNHRDGRDVKIDAMGYDIITKAVRVKSPSHFTLSQILFEFKLEMDPFDDLGIHFVFSSAAMGGRTDITGQLADYVTEQHALQHHVFSFLVFIVKDGYRLIRADRDGFVVTERRSWQKVEDAKLLAEFLWRFDGLSDEQRGSDPTVSLVDASEEDVIRRIRTHLTRWKFSSSCKTEPPMLKVEVPRSNGKPRIVYAWYPVTEPEFIISRATRGYPVLDDETNTIMFLKDTWRSTLPGMPLEASVLQKLNNAGVRNIPKLACGGDLEGQETLTPNYALKPWRRPGDVEMEKRRPQGVWHRRIHHRLLEDFIGTPLRAFTSSKQLLQVTYDAFLAHKDAVEKCRILHRDISYGNILIRENPANEGEEPTVTGILIDWEMAVDIDECQEPRTPFRTGTWAFMSAACLANPKKLQTIQDDLESFLWVIMWFGLRYLTHNHDVLVLRTSMASLFEESRGIGFNETGGTVKFGYLMFPHREPLGRSFSFTCKPLTRWLRRMVPLFQAWYTYERACVDYESSFEDDDDDDDTRNPDEPPKLEKQALRNHDKMEGLFTAALESEEWPHTGEETIKDQCPSQTGKRSREDDDEGTERKKAKSFNPTFLFQL